MKKSIILTIFIFFIFLLTSCFQNNDAVNNAKKELWIFDKNNQGELINIKKEPLNTEGIKNINNSEKNIEKKVVEIQKEKKFIIKSLTANNFIELDSLEWKTFNDWEIEITWKTLLNVDKIEVSFTNKSSDFPIDNYTLKQFKSWDKTFKYRAFSRYQTLDYGKNEYIFTAFSASDISKLSLIINLENPKNNNKTSNENVKQINDKVIFEKKNIWGWNENKYLNFPKSKSFWEMISTWESSFTYSNINNFRVEKKDVSSISCSNITDELTASIKSWFYWNTCRDIIKDKWIKFNVIRLEQDKYFYERHYVDYNNSLYWVFLIETWTMVTSENIKAKNDELKTEKFNSIKLVDNLFYEIVR